MTNTSIEQVPEYWNYFHEWVVFLDSEVATLEKSEATRNTYVNSVQSFLQWLQNDGRTVDRQVITDYKAWLLKADYAPKTINLHLSSMRQFFGWLEVEYELLYNPTSGIKSAKVSNKIHKRDPLSDSEIRRLLSKPDTSTTVGIRDRAILALLCFTAIRQISLHRADIDDLRKKGNRTVLDIQGKGHVEADDYVVIASAFLEDALANWIQKRNKVKDVSEALFVSLSHRTKGQRLSTRAVRDIVKTYLREIGVDSKRKTTHSLRHAAIMKVMKETNGDLLKVQGMSKHVSLETLQVYLTEMQRDEDPAEGYISYGESIS